MLVLSRKKSESILIGPDISVTITRVGKKEVRLGIDAPPDVLIRRGEFLAQWIDDAQSVAVGSPE